jgi:hypothetical protein
VLTTMTASLTPRLLAVSTVWALTTAWVVFSG